MKLKTNLRSKLAYPKLTPVSTGVFYCSFVIFIGMFKYISEILKSFSPAQRITALLILVFSIIILTLGPSLINSNTNTCDELNIRIKSQEQQIVELNTRVNELNTELLSGQKLCTDNLIAKQKEIMSIVNGMIHDAECLPKTTVVKQETHERMMMKSNGENGGTEPMMMPSPNTEVVIIKDNTDMVKKLKTMKTKIEKNFIKQ